jgi:hypothetical protein
MTKSREFHPPNALNISILNREENSSKKNKSGQKKKQKKKEMERGMLFVCVYIL